MDPVTIGAVLAAVAGGAGGALGAQVWAAACALVRRPFDRDRSVGFGPAAGSGAAELAALQQAPGDVGRGLALAEVLVARAGTDTGFAAALAAWWDQARDVQVGGNVANNISGGTQHGPVLQGRDFTGLTFTTPAPSSSSSPSGAPPEDGEQ